MKYKFSPILQGGNARYKLVVYQGKSCQLRYSFDGRMNQTGTSIKSFDQPKHWLGDHALEYLKKLFQKDLRNPMVTYAYISDASYPAQGKILTVFNLAQGDWTDKQADQVERYQAHQARIADNAFYSFRLAVPLKPVDDVQKWVSFFTKSAQTGDALSNLIAQFNTWHTLNPHAPQPIGQIYGAPDKIFDVSEREVPRVGWFDVKLKLPKYHQTQRVIEGYDKWIKMHQDFEELLSNI